MALGTEGKQPFLFSVDCEIIAVIEMTVRSNAMYTQEQLESMSDFEINKLVAEKECRILFTDQYDSPSVVTVEKYGCQPSYNYCNSWADMGPIIERDDLWDALTCHYAIPEYVPMSAWRAKTIEYKCSPLRAAAIVYLMME